MCNVTTTFEFCEISILQANIQADKKIIVHSRVISVRIFFLTEAAFEKSFVCLSACFIVKIGISQNLIVKTKDHTELYIARFSELFNS